MHSNYTHWSIRKLKTDAMLGSALQSFLAQLSVLLLERVCKKISFFHCYAKNYRCFWLRLCYIKGIG